VEETITRSRLLTAGEVNDFRKWKMWEDYSQNEFSQFSKQWQLFPTHRYLVQLQNADHRGIVGQPVYLLDRSTADTVWKAVTDNTGKAELWAGFMGMEAKKYYIAVRDHQNTIVASEFKDGINKLQLEKVCSVPNKVEIAFVVDATGSMGDEIEYLKVELEDVIRSTFEKYNDLDLKLGSVFYRDTKDEYLTKHINFQPDLLKVLNFVKLQSAGGGGDMPEAVDVALQTALDSLKWSQDARAKILFLVLDAPPHADVANRMLHLIVKASAMGVRIVPIACSGTDKNTEFLMRSMALATNGTYLFLTDNSGIGGTHIKPTTDAFDVELLNDLLRRTIEQMVFVQPCAPGGGIEVPIKPFENISKIQLYPNPTNGKLTIENSKGLKEIYVTDFTGKILIRIAASPKIKKYQLDLSTYPSGGYFIRYITEDNTWGAEKVIVAR
ncbi:MAG: hypothetical protein K0Q66_2337, partial [Chitinophagaceae bacterium]|nr:hypothetical protein [Chitinophagaceae bacterium]